MGLCIGIVALVALWFMPFPALCTFWEHVDAYQAEASNSARGKHSYSIEDTSPFDESHVNFHDQTRPAKRRGGDQGQVLVPQNNGPLPVFIEKHEKMHQDYSELIADLEALETSFNNPTLKDSVTSERILYKRLKRHLIGWTIGTTNQLIVPHAIRVSVLAQLLKNSLHDIRVDEPKSLPIFKEAVTLERSLAKLEVQLGMEKVIFLTVTYLYDYQKINESQLLDLFCDLPTLKLIGRHIHDIYQSNKPSSFWPSVSFFMEDRLLTHLHKIFRAFSRVTRMGLVHIVLSKTCQSSLHFDRLRFNLHGPKFIELVDKTGDEFLKAILKNPSDRTPSEVETVRQAVHISRDESVKEEAMASLNRDSPSIARSRSKPTTNGIISYIRGFETTRYLLRFFLQYSIAQLVAKDPEEQSRIETTYLERTLLNNPQAEEKAAKLLFDPTIGCCQVRAPEWKLWPEPYPWETPAAQSKQPIDLTGESSSSDSTREQLRSSTIHIDLNSAQRRKAGVHPPCP